MPGRNGSDFLLYVDTGSDFEALAGQRNMSIEKNAATIDVSHKLDDYENFLPGRKSSTISFDGLVALEDGAYQALEAAYDNSELIVVREMVDGEPYQEADGFLTSISRSSPDQDAATFSANFQVSGAWRDAAA